MDRLRITGGRVLLRSDGEQAVDLTLEDGRIAGIGRDGQRRGTGCARVCWCCRASSISTAMRSSGSCSRGPASGFAADIALHDTEAQLLANGITTAFHGVTLSWEPGLRSLAAWQALLDALEARRWTCDMRVHLRWEAYNLDALDIALADIAAGRVHLLAFNDHTPSILRQVKDPVVGAKYSDRAGMKLDDFRALAEQVGARARCRSRRAGTDCRGSARGRTADGKPRRCDDRHAPGVSCARRAHLRVPDGRGGRAGGQRGG